jgi:hypothetical protein
MLQYKNIKNPPKHGSAVLDMNSYLAKAKCHRWARLLKQQLSIILLFADQGKQTSVSICS